MWLYSFPGPLHCHEPHIHGPFGSSAHPTIKADTGTQEKRKSGLGHQPVCYRFQPQDRVRKNCFLVMFYFFRSQQSRVTGPARGWLHTSCSQYLCRRWWPWLESIPVENWIPLASGELHLCKFSPEANPPSLGFTVLTSQLLLTHHLEWCKGCFFIPPLVSFMLGQHLAFSIFVDHKYSRVALTPGFAFISWKIPVSKNRANTSTSKGYIHTPSSCYSPWPVLKYLFSFSLQFFYF